jgi:tetratricopeptide (TPR) repeat protein
VCHARVIGVPTRIRRPRDADGVGRRAVIPRRGNPWGLAGLLVAGLLVVGLVVLTVGVARWPGIVALIGLGLAVPPTAESCVRLVRARRAAATEALDRAALARRMLAVRRAEEVTPSIPGGAAVDLDYLPETELVTFRSLDDQVAAFDDLVATITEAGGPLVLVGAPGSGKTFTARRIVTTLLEEATAGTGPLAERFLLSRWDGAPLMDWLSREWAGRRECRIGSNEVLRLIADPSVVLVLDSLDEVPNARRQACVDAINAFVDLHPSARLVVCCRNREYRALAQPVESRRVRWIAPLDVERIGDFIAAHGPPSWERVRATVAYDQALRSLLSTPLMLVAALRAFRDDPTPLLAGPLTERQHALWDRYVERMLLTGDQPCDPLDDQRRWLEDCAITMAATGTLELARAPRRLRRFMNRCLDRHLLRRSAEGYQCIHRQLLGHLVARSGLADTPQTLRGRVLARVPSEAQAWSNLAREALAAGHNEPAAELSSRAVDLDPDNPRFLSDHAFHLFLATRLGAAATVARAAEAADPHDWRPSSTLAYTLFALGDIEGSAAARRRAWANGHRQSDGSFLSYILTLQGMRDEAYSMFDRLRAMDEDSTRMDRALALKALGRAGEAVESLFLSDLDELDAGLLVFTVPAAVARSFIPEDVFELVEPEPGAARLIVFLADNVRNRWGTYDEVVITVSVRPRAAPDEPKGSFVLHRFVNERLTDGVGQRTLAVPSAMAGIAVRHGANDVTFRLEAGGHPTLTVSMPRIPGPGRVKRIEATLYSVVAGTPCRTTELFDMPPLIAADASAVSVDIGNGVVADMLRRLGLPRSPDHYAWGEGLTLTYRLPQPLRTDG